MAVFTANGFRRGPSLLLQGPQSRGTLVVDCSKWSSKIICERTEALRADLEDPTLFIFAVATCLLGLPLCLATSLSTSVDFLLVQLWNQVPSSTARAAPDGMLLVRQLTTVATLYPFLFTKQPCQLAWTCIIASLGTGLLDSFSQLEFGTVGSSVVRVFQTVDRLPRQ